MSTPISIRTPYLFGTGDYEPASDESRKVKRALESTKYYLSATATDWLPSIDAALHDIQRECNRSNWDGEEALPILGETIEFAAQISATLYELLPKGTPVPDIIPESDGEICISWSVDQARMFSVSVGDHGKINFAGQFGKAGGIHAWQPIDTTSRGSIENSLDDVVRYVGRLFANIAVRRAA